MSGEHSPDVNCPCIISWGYKTQKEVEKIHLTSEVRQDFSSLHFDQRLKMRLCVSLAFVCTMLSAGKNRGDEQSVQKLIQDLSLFLLAFVKIFFFLPAGYGLKCFTCWGDNPGTCNQIWNCPASYDRCATTIGMFDLPSHVALVFSIFLLWDFYFS